MKEYKDWYKNASDEMHDEIDVLMHKIYYMCIQNASSITQIANRMESIAKDYDFQFQFKNR